jgi:hypothetical protein
LLDSLAVLFPQPTQAWVPGGYNRSSSLRSQFSGFVHSKLLLAAMSIFEAGSGHKPNPNIVPPNGRFCQRKHDRLDYADQQEDLENQPGVFSGFATLSGILARTS